MMKKDDRIFVAGHRGMVGSAICRKLRAQGYDDLVTRSRSELDLTDQRMVRDFFRNEKIDHVVLAAARVGGIHANDAYPANFIYENLMIETNVIHGAHLAGVHHLLFLGSSCIYPRDAVQPMKESALMTGPLEPTNEPYAAAKIAGIKLCESYNRQHGASYRSVMPTNLYGPNDNYDLMNSHVLPALIRKFHLARLASAKDWVAIQRDETVYGPIPPDVRSALEETPPKVVLWGSGAPRREFLHVDDLASACVFVMSLSDEDYQKWTRPMQSHVNVGVGKDASIAELAEMVKGIVGYEGEMVWDATQPDGAPRKLLDVSLLTRMGWTAGVSLRKGIQDAYDAYLSHFTDRPAGK